MFLWELLQSENKTLKHGVIRWVAGSYLGCRVYKRETEHKVGHEPTTLRSDEKQNE